MADSSSSSDDSSSDFYTSDSSTDEDQVRHEPMQQKLKVVCKKGLVESVFFGDQKLRLLHVNDDKTKMVYVENASLNSSPVQPSDQKDLLPIESKETDTTSTLTINDDVTRYIEAMLKSEGPNENPLDLSVAATLTQTNREVSSQEKEFPSDIPLDLSTKKSHDPQPCSSPGSVGSRSSETSITPGSYLVLETSNNPPAHPEIHRVMFIEPAKDKPIEPSPKRVKIESNYKALLEKTDAINQQICAKDDKPISRDFLVTHEHFLSQLSEDQETADPLMYLWQPGEETQPLPFKFVFGFDTIEDTPSVLQDQKQSNEESQKKPTKESPAK